MNMREQLPLLIGELGNPIWAKKDPAIVDVENVPVIPMDSSERDAFSDLLERVNHRKELPSIGRTVEPPFWRGLWFWIWNKKLERHILEAPESLRKEGWAMYSHNALSMVAQALVCPEVIYGDDSAKLLLGNYFVRWPSWFARFVLLVEERVDKPDAPTTHLIFMGWPGFAERSEQNQLCDLARIINPHQDFKNEANHLNDLRSEYRKKMRNIPWLVE